MNGYLVDTNVLSELRKGPRANARVRAWIEPIRDDEIFLSVLVLGEIRKGIERVRRRDPRGAAALDRWLAAVRRDHADRVLPVDLAVAERWGELDAAGPLPAIDGLLAATAMTYDLVLVTRNVRDVRRTGVACLDPFAAT